MPSTERLDVRVAREFALSRRRAQDAIEAGQVDVGVETALNPGRTVGSDERVRLDRNRRRLAPLHLSLDTPYLDETLAVIDKPPGLLTVPTDGGADDCVLSRVRTDLSHVRGPRAYAGALHRLDRGTSGLVAIALSKECHAKGRDAFREHRFVRRYLALVEGVPQPRSGVIDLPIADEYEAGRRRLARDDDEPSRDAVTHYRVKEALRRASLVELELETGRQHQIRLHLRALGHPILGDGVYGSKEQGSRSRPFLHAHYLAFPHPLTGDPIACESDPPADFGRALNRQRKNART